MTLPERPWLDLAVGTVEEAPVTFRVGIVRAGEEETILGEMTVTEAHRWEPSPREIDAFAGEKVTLSLSLDADEPGTLGFWGAPAVRNRGAVPAHADATQGSFRRMPSSPRRSAAKSWSACGALATCSDILCARMLADATLLFGPLQSHCLALSLCFQ